ncbi:Hypothetical predicted protein, partial [Pelobates cultripes]
YPLVLLQVPTPRTARSSWFSQPVFPSASFSRKHAKAFSLQSVRPRAAKSPAARLLTPSVVVFSVVTST